MVVDEVDVTVGNVTFTNNSASCDDMADMSNCGGGGLLVRARTRAPAARMPRRMPALLRARAPQHPPPLSRRPRPPAPPPPQARSVLRLVVSNSTFTNNYVLNGGFGGGLYARYGAYGRVDTSLFLGNQAGAGALPGAWGLGAAAWGAAAWAGWLGRAPWGLGAARCALPPGLGSRAPAPSPGRPWGPARAARVRPARADALPLTPAPLPQAAPCGSTRSPAPPPSSRSSARTAPTTRVGLRCASCSR